MNRPGYLTFLFSAAVILYWPAVAQESRVEVDIPPGEIVESLKYLSKHADVQLIYRSDSLVGLRSEAIRGRYYPGEILEKLLQGSAFVGVRDGETGAFAIIPREEGDVSTQASTNTPNLNSPLLEQSDMQLTQEKSKPTMKAVLGGILSLAVIGNAPIKGQDEADEVFELTPFEVSSDSVGYQATSSLAGTRLRTNLSDIGSSVSVFTEELMNDVAAVDNESLLAYGLGTEVGGARGNFVNADSFGIENQNVAAPNTNTRIRGLTRADNTRNFYLTDVPWDGYIINRVDIQRGANSVLFGVGSPAGIINATTVDASMHTGGELQYRYDRHGSNRVVLDYNREIIEGQLAARVAILHDHTEFRQNPAHEDDERIFLTTTWQPNFLNGDSTLFKAKGSFSRGTIDANRPRYVAPIDQISDWFAEPGTSGFQGTYSDFADWGLGGRLVDPINENEIQTANNSSGRFYSAFVGTTFGGINPKLIYDETSEDFILHTENYVNHRGGWYVADADSPAVINDGTTTGNEIQGHIRGTHTMKIWGYNRASADGGLPLQGFWKDKSFTDTSYFDFYNQLIDGTSKSELKDWETYEIDISHTFFDNKIGYNLGYFYQDYDAQNDFNLGQVFAPAITVDISALDRTATPGNRVPNPRAGRAYVSSDNPSGTIQTINRDSRRFQAFINHDFKDNNDGFLGRLFGVHDVVGVHSSRSKVDNRRNYNLLGYDRAYILGRGDVIENDGTPRLDARLAEYGVPNNAYTPDFHFFLGHDGSGIRGLQGIGNMRLPSSGAYPLQGFDATPLPGFDAATAAQRTFIDPYAGDGVFNAESRNPEYYAGWQQSVGSYHIVNAHDSPEALKYLTTGRSLNTEEIDSNALVWTGRFWDGAFVGMYGWREDESTETWPSHNFRNEGEEFLPDELIANGKDGRAVTRSTETQSRNWSVKADLGRLTGNLMDGLPFDLHVLYSEGEVQTPDPSRIDVFDRTLANALGETEDLSLVAITKDGKWSMRLTEYTTTVTNAVSNSTVNREKWRLQQVLQQGALRAGFIETDASGYTNEDLALSPSASAAGYSSEADYRREVMAPAWRAFERRLWEEVPLAQTWYLSEFQPGDRTAPRILFPDGATLVENQVSEGYEFELTANPTANWTLAFNASKSEAIRDGLPGPDFGQAIDLIAEEMKGPAGEIPIWWNAGPGVGGWLNPFIGEVVLARALNGARQPEVREWRGNIITNYQFTEGKFKGFGIGGAARYEDGQIYSYRPFEDADGNLQVDLNTYWADGSRETFDFWLKYNTKVTDNVDWHIQLNLFNVFGDNELVPLHRNPDGTFGQMGIREGSSWSLTNSFRF